MTQTQAARILGIAAAAMRKTAADNDPQNTAQIGEWRDNLAGHQNSYIQQLQGRWNSYRRSWSPVRVTQELQNRWETPGWTDITKGQLDQIRSSQAAGYAQDFAPYGSAPELALRQYYQDAGKNWNYPTYLRTGKLPEKAYLENEPEKWPEVIRAMSPEERQKVFQNARTMVDNRRTAPNQAVS